jgi:hypothetical protein
MISLLPQLLAMIVSASVFMTLSVRFGWSRKLWAFLNRKLNPAYSTVLWLLFAAVLHLTLQLVCKGLGIADSRLITGILIGLYFAFIPSLGGKNK